MGRMSRVLEIDEASGLRACRRACSRPDLEEQLGARGWTAGHFPDSFAHSTLGGWIATRSSGMQSDKYGDIADLTRAMRGYPGRRAGHAPTFAASTGPDVRQMVLGSEGRLGIITEATIHVHRTPAQRVILGYLFPDWPRALSAMREVAAGDTAPSVTRVSDAPETKFSFATKKTPTALDRAKSKALMTFLARRKGYDLDQLCLSFIGFEGSERHVKRQRRLVGRVVARHGGLCIGRSPGELYDQKKFDTPYIRDYLLDRGALADVSETSAPWSLLPEVYDEVMAAAREASRGSASPATSCATSSHSYHAGACLYFTFAIKPRAFASRWTSDVVKSAIQQAFIDAGATLSHHHAVGTEHARWLEEDISAAGVAMVRALLRASTPAATSTPARSSPNRRATARRAERRGVLSPCRRKRRRAASRSGPRSWSRRCARDRPRHGVPVRARPAQHADRDADRRPPRRRPREPGGDVLRLPALAFGLHDRRARGSPRLRRFADDPPPSAHVRVGA